MFSIFGTPRSIFMLGASTFIACSGEKVLENTNNHHQQLRLCRIPMALKS